eukprot:sb/3479715/
MDSQTDSNPQKCQTGPISRDKKSNRSPTPNYPPPPSTNRSTTPLLPPPSKAAEPSVAVYNSPIQSGTNSTSRKVSNEKSSKSAKSAEIPPRFANKNGCLKRSSSQSWKEKISSSKQDTSNTHRSNMTATCPMCVIPSNSAGEIRYCPQCIPSQHTAAQKPESPAPSSTSSSSSPSEVTSSSTTSSSGVKSGRRSSVSEIVEEFENLSERFKNLSTRRPGRRSVSPFTRSTSAASSTRTDSDVMRSIGSLKEAISCSSIIEEDPFIEDDYISYDENTTSSNSNQDDRFATPLLDEIEVRTRPEQPLSTIHSVPGSPRNTTGSPQQPLRSILKSADYRVLNNGTRSPSNPLKMDRGDILLDDKTSIVGSDWSRPGNNETSSSSLCVSCHNLQCRCDNGPVPNHGNRDLHHGNNGNRDHHGNHDQLGPLPHQGDNGRFGPGQYQDNKIRHVGGYLRQVEDVRQNGGDVRQGNNDLRGSTQLGCHDDMRVRITQLRRSYERLPRVTEQLNNSYSGQEQHAMKSPSRHHGGRIFRSRRMELASGFYVTDHTPPNGYYGNKGRNSPNGYYGNKGRNSPDGYHGNNGRKSPKPLCRDCRRAIDDCPSERSRKEILSKLPPKSVVLNPWKTVLSQLDCENRNQVFEAIMQILNE